MNLPKYVRIQGREVSYMTQKPAGIFALCWRCIRNGVFNEEEKELFVQTDNWFVENLPYPPFYGENNDDADANTLGAITYFKNNDETSAMLEHFAPVFEILDRHQIPYDFIYTNYAGKIIYEDDYQIGVIDAE